MLPRRPRLVGRVCRPAAAVRCVCRGPRDVHGRVRLPAFGAGPLEILQVGVPGRWPTAVMKNVAVTAAGVDVTLPIE